MSGPPGPLRERVSAHIERIALPSPTLPPATTTNAWVLGEDDVLVIDPGCPWPEGQAALRRALAGRRVRAVLLTHHHPDHVGGLDALLADTGAPAYAHPLTAQALGRSDLRPLRDGEAILVEGHRWRALHTPGHAVGHLCLWSEAESAVVAGDMVAGEGTIILAPPDADLAAFMAGLARLAALEPTWALPAHGPALTPGGDVFRMNMAHRAARTEALLAALRAEAQAPAALVSAVYGLLPPAVQPLAEVQLHAHLRFLVQEGRAEERAEGWARAG